MNLYVELIGLFQNGLLKTPDKNHKQMSQSELLYEIKKILKCDEAGAHYKDNIVT
jgi:hypothetical protein